MESVENILMDYDEDVGMFCTISRFYVNPVGGHRSMVRRRVITV